MNDTIPPARTRRKVPLARLLRLPPAPSRPIPNLDWVTPIRSGAGQAADWRNAAIDVACGLFAIIPLLVTAHIPLYDLPNHIAMLHVLLERADSPALRQIYGVYWRFTPNMALQVFTWMAAHFLSVEAAARLFCVTTVLLLCAGTRALGLALAEGDAGLRLYRAAPLLCWGAPLQFGFIGYCCGVALMLCGLALYVRWRDRHWALLAAVFLPFSVVLLACHLIAFGLFVTALAGYETACVLGEAGSLRSRAIRLARRAVLVASLTLPALLVLWLAPPLGANAAPDFAHAIKPSSLFFKAQSLAAVTWFAMPMVEIPLLLAALTCLAIGMWRRVLRVMLGAGGMVAALAALWLVLPRDVSAGHYVDYRLPWAISFVVLAALVAPVPARERRRPALRAALAGVLAGLVVLRVGSICWRALTYEPEVAAVDRALSGLATGSSVWVIKGAMAGSAMKTPPLENTLAFIVSRRQGFEPQVFAGAAGELVYLQPRYRAMFRLVVPQNLDSVPAGYDAVLVLNPALVRTAPGLALHCLASGSHFALYANRGPALPCRQQVALSNLP